MVRVSGVATWSSRSLARGVDETSWTEGFGCLALSFVSIRLLPFPFRHRCSDSIRERWPRRDRGILKLCCDLSSNNNDELHRIATWYFPKIWGFLKPTVLLTFFHLTMSRCKSARNVADSHFRSFAGRRGGTTPFPLGSKRFVLTHCSVPDCAKTQDICSDDMVNFIGP